MRSASSFENNNAKIYFLGNENEKTEHENLNLIKEKQKQIEKEDFCVPVSQEVENFKEKEEMAPNTEFIIPNRIYDKNANSFYQLGKLLGEVTHFFYFKQMKLI
jgi:hypothetical protein